LLPNGKVLAAGGGYNAGYFSSAELYDPASGTWIPTGFMASNRAFHTATLLPNGKVLIAGGLSSQSIYNHTSNGAELYNPTTGTWRVTGAMAAARYSHSATLLLNGKVLVAGGNRDGSLLASADWYDPSAETWTSAGAMTVPRSQHTATLLPNGKVLVAGGVNQSSAELFDPASGMWTVTGSMTTVRRLHTAALLANGKVLVVGGSGGVALSSAETYDPITGTWTVIPAMALGRYSHAETLLPNGKVLITGGGLATSVFTSSAELYHPDTGTWVAGAMNTARGEHTATLLPNGSVLVSGGRNRIGNSVISTSSTELYVDATGTVTLGDLIQTYDGTAKSVSVVTIPPGLTVKVTYNGSTNAPSDAGSYIVIGTIDDPSYSGNATNTLVIGIQPVIVGEPTSRTNNSGTVATFSVAADGTPPLVYEWRKDGAKCSDVNSSILTLTNVGKNDEGLYSVVISNVFGVVVSSDARLTVNLPPVADATATIPLAVAVNGSNATVVLDGSRSFDPDGDSLQYTWSDGSATALTNGVIAVVTLPAGTNSITLLVSDGLASASQTISVEVITPAQTISRLMDAAGDASTKQSLLATLRAALVAVSRSNSTAAINQLQAFQNQVNAQLGPIDPVTTQMLISEAQAIIDSLDGHTTPPSKVNTISKLNGKSRLNFSGRTGQIYIIEASSDLVHWDKIGVAKSQSDGDFGFEDSNSPSLPARYYRVVVP
jgi:hypothetical protein